jgi:poly(A) polymerase Pap1
MLPDFPSIKEKLLYLLNARMKRVKSALLVPFSEAPESRILEGDKIVLVREDGSAEQVEIREIKVERQIDLTEVERMTPETIKERIDAVAKEMAVQQSKVLFEDLDKAIRKSGNVIDFGRRSFCIEDFFKALEMVWIDFDENDQSIMPTIVAGEKTSDAIAKVLQEAESNPKCRKRLQEIITIKKAEWRDREANRKLVG